MQLNQTKIRVKVLKYSILETMSVEQVNAINYRMLIKYGHYMRKQSLDTPTININKKWYLVIPS